ncbi:MAG TPA: cupin domain-containing protein [Solirubrobacteraceae bacterium]|nr:cupin domain-containing protein [Solirubrobacteraceae bacterium]
MARAGQTIENPVSGERCRWLLTAEQTDGRLTRAELTVRPGGGVALEHVHPRSEERFELLEGELTLEVDGGRTVLHAGERATVPAGVPHRWANQGTGPLRLVTEMDPPAGLRGPDRDDLCARARRTRRARTGSCARWT